MLNVKDKFLIGDFIKTKEGEFNLLNLCEYLIEHGADASRYLSDKPIIFGYVALYIDSFLDEYEEATVYVKPDKSDVEYRLNGRVQKEISIEKDTEENKQLKKDTQVLDDQPEQLVLF